VTTPGTRRKVNPAIVRKVDVVNSKPPCQPNQSFSAADRQARRAALAKLGDQATGETRPTPRGKRERIYKHYSYTLTLILEELAAPEGVREFVEAIIAKIGFDATDWTRCCNETLARFVAASDAEGRIKAAYHRMKRQRLALIEFQDKYENPTLIQCRLEFDQEAKRQYPEYKLPLAQLLRDVVEACPVGTRDRILKDNVRRLVQRFLRDNEKIRQRPKKKKRQTPESKLNAALTLARQGYAEERQQYGETSARNALGALIGALNQVLESPPEAGLPGLLDALQKAPNAPYVENAKTEKTGIDNKGFNPKSIGQNANALHRGVAPENTPEFDLVPTSINEVKFHSKTDRKKEPIGQSAEEFEEFLAAQNSQPAARSSKADEWLSLAELEAFDPKAGGHGKRNRKFYCPIHQGNSRSLNANTQTGAYFCHACEAKGKLREYCDAPAPAPTRVFQRTEPEKTPVDDRWKKWVADAKSIASTPGADYLESRGIPTAAAATAGVKFGRWWRRNEEANKPEAFEAVIFPIKNLDGEVVAAQARAIVGGDKRTRGEKSAGIFFATPAALDSKVVAVTEAPIDALALAACGLDAIALCGTNWPDWLPDALAGCDVLLATDADDAGDQCASDLARELQGRASIRRLRPEGVKDWAELSDLEGLDSVRAQIADF
jgi:DNA primase